MTTARPRCPSRRGPCQCQKSLCFSNLATPCPSFIEPINNIVSCRKPSCGCGYNDQIILPPLSVELPCGLGYFPSASPLVAKCFAPALDYLTTGAYIPIAAPCDSLILAAPVSPDIAPLVKPLIL